MLTDFFQFRSSSAHSSPVRDFRRPRLPDYADLRFKEYFFLSSASHFINPSCILQFQPTLLLPSSRLSIVRLSRCPSFSQRHVVCDLRRSSPFFICDVLQTWLCRICGCFGFWNCEKCAFRTPDNSKSQFVLIFLQNEPCRCQLRLPSRQVAHRG